MKLTFWGASKQVTGSMYLLETDDDYRVLIDCGFDLDNTTETMPLYPGAIFPFDASMVNVTLVTHAHVDHSGKIPNLIREGFEGQILCTPPTLALIDILLHDSASINQRKLKAIQKRKSQRKGKRSYDQEINTSALYLDRQVDDALDQFVTINFNRKFTVKPGLDITFIPAGHLLGAAHILLEVKEKDQIKKILFSGDIGRKDYPLLVNPAVPPQVDYVVCETTYGKRLHVSNEKAIDELEKAIIDCCVKEPGRLIIPSFSVGRTQAVLFTLHKLAVENRLPKIKIFADSPMAYASNKVYRQYHGYLNEEAQNFKEKYGEILDFENLIYVKDGDESKEISNYSEPCIIVSSSGMLEGGRIQQHIINNLGNAYCTLLMIGFCAEGTFGDQLLKAKETIRIGDKHYKIQCKIKQTDVLSGHGDRDDLIKFIKAQPSDKLKNIFLVHGEEESMIAFKDTLAEIGYTHVEIPEKGQTFEL